MAGKVLITVGDMFIKSVILKYLHEKGFEILEAAEEIDLFLKLDIFKESILYYIIQINQDTFRKQYDMIKKIRQKEYFENMPVMAIIPEISKEYIEGAKEAEVNDVVPVPAKRELLRNYLPERISAFTTKIPVTGDECLEKIRENILSDLSTNSDMENEIKRASRGNYPVSFVMGRVSGIHIGLVQEFYDNLLLQMRETDRIVNYDYRVFIIVCPFTMKKHVTEIEKKARITFEKMFKGIGKLYIYSATYPDYGERLEKLVEIMEKGVHDSIVISGMRQPLNTLSKDKLEEFKNMLKLYK
ncbi:hypothetical protein Cst_c06740 [Thermoclostridium stercorarium subsp. stercorarium DSM 8532]|uniref:Uncharacterized protein n=2 Tax=Thermoclostridium stercorarium TaxID=1510 RepID=L7VM44_THES1|nr:hypothetical protein [Thermoclostridium stercorarium]AGC67689.1 hypothetical protein Cst_c06740 [Thermoclostridium stercorarium subsp. stercorarium DSM 8532]AGI38737.1 hypothetical protein Clst_0643 [Thermoclostridium stercorarium subsp. stercorarium DSM 8532]